ncbi:MAG: hypothetical protein ABI847_09870 [Anaerolineales bacterium]
MTERSMQAGLTPTVLVHAGGDVRVRGVEGDRVRASTGSRWGLKLERKSPTEVARLRAKVGERVLLDVRFDPLRQLQKDPVEDPIDVQLSGSGEVTVPVGSLVIVYGGKSVDVAGPVAGLTVFASRDVVVRGAGILNAVSSGGALDFECDSIGSQPAKFSAGGDLRCYIRGLTDARVWVSDLGGEWEGLLGAGGPRIELRAGGDVVLVTKHPVEAQPPEYVLGRVERPGEA